MNQVFFSKNSPSVSKEGERDMRNAQQGQVNSKSGYCTHLYTLSNKDEKNK